MNIRARESVARTTRVNAKSAFRSCSYLLRAGVRWREELATQYFADDTFRQNLSMTRATKL